MPKIYALKDPQADRPARAWHWREPTGYIHLRQWETLATLTLSGQAFRLLCAVIAHTDWSNRCTATLAALGRSAHLTRSTVARVLPQLIASRCLVVDRTNPRQPSVTLNPTYVWKGRPWHRRYAQAQFWAAWQLHHGSRACGDPSCPPQEGAEHPPGNHPGEFSHPFTQYEPPTELSAVDEGEEVGIGEEGGGDG